jgi:hypothetical protein
MSGVSPGVTPSTASVVEAAVPVTVAVLEEEELGKKEM